MVLALNHAPTGNPIWKEFKAATPQIAVLHGSNFTAPAKQLQQRNEKQLYRTVLFASSRMIVFISRSRGLPSTKKKKTHKNKNKRKMQKIPPLNKHNTHEARDR